MEKLADDSLLTGMTVQHGSHRTQEILLIGDKRIAAMPIYDNGEALVDLVTEPELHVDVSRKHVNKLSPSISKVRVGVVRQLLFAQRHLPEGIGLLIREGYRPLSVQQALFDRYCRSVRMHNPELTDGAVLEEVSKFVAPPEMAPHSTGGAVDLTLFDLASYCELDMGSPFNGDPISTGGATYTAASNISGPARKNRDILSGAMSMAGFENYPTEWWHWSVGDRYWAYCGGKAYAIYGGMESG